MNYQKTGYFLLLRKCRMISYCACRRVQRIFLVTLKCLNYADKRTQKIRFVNHWESSGRVMNLFFILWRQLFLLTHSFVYGIGTRPLERLRDNLGIGIWLTAIPNSEWFIDCRQNMVCNVIDEYTTHWIKSCTF